MSALDDVRSAARHMHTNCRPRSALCYAFATISLPVSRWFVCFLLLLLVVYIQMSKKKFFHGNVRALLFPSAAAAAAASNLSEMVMAVERNKHKKFHSHRPDRFLFMIHNFFGA
jgi:hypothetical protein